MEIEPIRIFIVLGVFYLFMIFYQVFIEIKPNNENVAMIKETMRNVDESAKTMKLPIQKRIVQILLAPIYFLENSLSYFGRTIFDVTISIIKYLFNKAYNYLF